MKRFFSLLLLSVLFLFCAIGCDEPSYPKRKPSAHSLFNKAQKKHKLKDNQEAFHLINEAIELDSTKPQYFELRGEILANFSDTLHMQEDFRHSLDLSQDDQGKEDMLEKIIDWEIAHDNKEEAHNFLKEELALYKDDSAKHIDIVNHVAKKYLVIGDTNESIHTYKSLLKEDKKLIEAHYELGIIYSHQKKYRQATRHFEDYHKLNQNNTSATYNLGYCYLKRNIKSKAKKYFKEASDKGHKKACEQYRELTAQTYYITSSKCCDGSSSSSTGRGTCSHHGGVCSIIHTPYKRYTVNCR